MRIAPLLTLTSLLAAAYPLQATTLLSVDFENSDLGNYDEDDVNADWPGSSVFQGVDEDPNDGVDGRTHIAMDPTGVAGNQVLCVDYPAGAAGSSDSGASFIVDLPGGNQEVWAEYRIFFPDDFDFGLGGKLPGLTGGTFPTGSTEADGTNGFSNRMMWRAQNAAGQSSGGATAPVGSANLIYLTNHPDAVANVNDEEENFQWIDPNSTYIDPVTGQPDPWVQVTGGNWYTITQQVVMNTPGEDDGVIRGWVDGVLMSEETDLGFTDDGSFAVDQFYFSTFYGGNTSFAPETDQKIYYDDFLVTTTPLFAVPEPGQIIFFGVAGLYFLSRRNRKRG